MKRHFMRLQSQPFNQIASGKKVYELRLYDEKRKAIDIGDEILFTEDGKDRHCAVKVVDILPFDSFDELYKRLPLEECGYAKDEAAAAQPSDMEKYYSKEKQSKYGVVAIKIELIKY